MVMDLQLRGIANVEEIFIPYESLNPFSHEIFKPIFILFVGFVVLHPKLVVFSHHDGLMNVGLGQFNCLQSLRIILILRVFPTGISI